MRSLPTMPGRPRGCWHPAPRCESSRHMAGAQAIAIAKGFSWLRQRGSGSLERPFTRLYRPQDNLAYGRRRSSMRHSGFEHWNCDDDVHLLPSRRCKNQDRWRCIVCFKKNPAQTISGKPTFKVLRTLYTRCSYTAVHERSAWVTKVQYALPRSHRAWGASSHRAAEGQLEGRRCDPA